MSVPKKRSAKRAIKTRAAHHGLDKVATIECSQCKQAIRPHVVCPDCGYYKGRNVFASQKKAPAKPTEEKVEKAKPVVKKAEPKAEAKKEKKQ